MTDICVLAIGQSLANGYYGPGYVSNGTYGSGPGPVDPTILAKASTRKTWVDAGFAYTLGALPQSKAVKVDPWQPARQNIGIANYRATLGFDAGISAKLIDLGYAPNVIKVSFGSTTSVEWTSTAGFMWLRMTRAVTAALASTRSPITTATKIFVYMDLGQSDAADAGLAPNYGTWLAAFAAALRTFLVTTTGFAAPIRFVIVKTNNYAPGGNATTLGQVQSGQAAFVAGDGGNSAELSTVYACWDSPPLHDTLAASTQKGQDAAALIVSTWAP